MPNGYTHLDLEERIEIEKCLDRGESVAAIARFLGRARSTISAEIRRNSFKPGRVYANSRPRVGKRALLNTGSAPSRFYSAATAQRYAEARAHRSHEPWRLGYGPLRQQVVGWIEAGQTPEMVSGRLSIDFPEDERMRVSHETIYAWIYREAPELKQYLWYARRKRRKRNGRRTRSLSQAGKRSIHDRPASVEDRLEVGHFECDSVLGKRGTGNLHTTVERKTRYLFAQLVDDGTSLSTIEAQRLIYSRIPSHLVRSITADNGSEFAFWNTLESELAGVKVYFAEPYSAYQRGTNEHFNGRIRKYLPKGTSFEDLTQGEVDEIVQEINNRPRKCLGWYTPQEMWDKELARGPDVSAA